MNRLNREHWDDNLEGCSDCGNCSSEVIDGEDCTNCGLSFEYYKNPKTDKDFMQIAIDAYGYAVRDNNKGSLISLGKEYHETGEL